MMAGGEDTRADKIVPGLSIPIQSSLWKVNFLVSSCFCIPFSSRLAHVPQQLVYVSLKSLGFHPVCVI